MSSANNVNVTINASSVQEFINILTQLNAKMQQTGQTGQQVASSGGQLASSFQNVGSTASSSLGPLGNVQTTLGRYPGTTSAASTGFTSMGGSLGNFSSSTTQATTTSQQHITTLGQYPTTTASATTGFTGFGGALTGVSNTTVDAEGKSRTYSTTLTATGQSAMSAVGPTNQFGQSVTKTADEQERGKTAAINHGQAIGTAVGFFTMATGSIMGMVGGLTSLEAAHVKDETATVRVEAAQKNYQKALDAVTKLEQAGVTTGKAYADAKANAALASDRLKVAEDRAQVTHARFNEAMAEFATQTLPQMLQGIGGLVGGFSQLSGTGTAIKGVFAGLGTTMSNFVSNVKGASAAENEAKTATTGLGGGLGALAIPIAAAGAVVLGLIASTRAVSTNFLGFRTGLEQVGAAIGNTLPFLKDFVTNVGDAGRATVDFFTRNTNEVLSWAGINVKSYAQTTSSLAALMIQYEKTGSTGSAVTDKAIEDVKNWGAQHGMTMQQIIAHEQQLEGQDTKTAESQGNLASAAGKNVYVIGSLDYALTQTKTTEESMQKAIDDHNKKLLEQASAIENVVPLNRQLAIEYGFTAQQIDGLTHKQLNDLIVALESSKTAEDKARASNLAYAASHGVNMVQEVTKSNAAIQKDVDALKAHETQAAKSTTATTKLADSIGEITTNFGPLGGILSGSTAELSALGNAAAATSGKTTEMVGSVGRMGDVFQLADGRLVSLTKDTTNSTDLMTAAFSKMRTEVGNDEAAITTYAIKHGMLINVVGQTTDKLHIMAGVLGLKQAAEDEDNKKIDQWISKNLNMNSISSRTAEQLRTLAISHGALTEKLDKSGQATQTFTQKMQDEITQLNQSAADNSKYATSLQLVQHTQAAAKDELEKARVALGTYAAQLTDAATIQDRYQTALAKGHGEFSKFIIDAQDSGNAASAFNDDLNKFATSNNFPTYIEKTVANMKTFDGALAGSADDAKTWNDEVTKFFQGTGDAAAQFVTGIGSKFKDLNKKMKDPFKDMPDYIRKSLTPDEKLGAILAGKSAELAKQVTGPFSEILATGGPAAAARFLQGVEGKMKDPKLKHIFDPVIAGLQSGTKEGVAGAIETLNKMGPEGQTIAKDLADKYGATITPALPGATTTAVDKTNTALGGVDASNATDKLGTISDTFATIGQAMNDALGRMPGYFSTQFGAAATAANNAIGPIADNFTILTQAINDTLGRMPAYFTTQFGAAAAAANLAIGPIADNFTILVQAINDTLGRMPAFFGTQFGAAGQAANTAIGTELGKLQVNANNAFAAVVNLARVQIPQVVPAFTTMKTNATTQLTGLEINAGNTFTAIKNLAGIVSQVVPVFTTMKTNASTQMTNLETNAGNSFSAVKNIAGIQIPAISPMFAALGKSVDAVTGKVYALGDAIKKLPTALPAVPAAGGGGPPVNPQQPVAPVKAGGLDAIDGLNRAMGVLNNTIGLLNTSIGSLNTQFTAMNTSMTSITTVLNTLGPQISTLAAEFVNTYNDVSTLAATIVNLTSDISGMAATVVNTMSDISGLARSIVTTSTDISVLARSVVTTSSDLSGLARVLVNVTSDISGLARAMVNTTRDISTLARTVVTLSADLSADARVIVNVTSDLGSMTRAMGSAASATQKLTSGISALSREGSAAARVMVNLGHDIANAGTSANGAAGRMSSLASNIGRVQTAAHNAAAAVQGLISKINGLHDKTVTITVNQRVTGGGVPGLSPVNTTTISSNSPSNSSVNNEQVTVRPVTSATLSPTASAASKTVITRTSQPIVIITKLNKRELARELRTVIFEEASQF